MRAPNLKHMYDGVNPGLAVERHMKEEMRKREYALDLERQIVERRKREMREKEMARAASRERIQHAMNAPTALIPSPSYATAKQKRMMMMHAPHADAPRLPPAPRAAKPTRNARELFPGGGAPGGGERRAAPGGGGGAGAGGGEDVRMLQGQLQQLQRRLDELQSGAAQQPPAGADGAMVADAQLADNGAGMMRSRHYEEDGAYIGPNPGAPRVRLKFEEPDERVRMEAEEAKKQQYARELQAQIAEKAARDRARKREQEEYDMKREREAMSHNPFGKMGGGAPLRNAQGEVEPSLHMLRSPENVKGSNAYVSREDGGAGGGGGGGGGGAAEQAPAEQGEAGHMPALNFRQDNPFQSREERDAKARLETDYQRALRLQIEEKNRLRAIEAERERQEIEREDRRLAEEQKKMKEQYEREQARERMKREKALHENTIAAAEKQRSREAEADPAAAAGPGAAAARRHVAEAAAGPAAFAVERSPVPAAHQPAPSGSSRPHSQPRQQPAPAPAPARVSMSPEPARRAPARAQAHGRHSRNELLSSMSRAELEKLRNEFQRQQDAFEERIRDVVSEKESEMIDLRERAAMAEEDREAARRELEMIKAEIRFRKNVRRMAAPVLSSGAPPPRRRPNLTANLTAPRRRAPQMEEGFGGAAPEEPAEEEPKLPFLDLAGATNGGGVHAAFGMPDVGLRPYPAASKPSTAASIDLGASLAGDSHFIFPAGADAGAARPVQTPGGVSEANTNLSLRSDIMDLPNPEEKLMVSEVEEVAVRNSRRLHLLSELESRRSQGENLDVLLGEFIERTREDEDAAGAPAADADGDGVARSQDLGRTLDTETRWV